MSNVYPHLGFFILNSGPIFLHADHLHPGISLASQIRTITTIIFPSITSLPVHDSHLGLNPGVVLNAHLSVFDSPTLVPAYKPGTASWMGMWFSHGLGAGREVSQRVREVILGNSFPFLRSLLCTLWLQDMIPGTVITILLLVRKWCQHPRHQSRYGKNLYFDDSIKLLFFIFQTWRLLYLVIPKFVRCKFPHCLSHFKLGFVKCCWKHP